jgi:hypothetical protein
MSALVSQRCRPLGVWRQPLPVLVAVCSALVLSQPLLAMANDFPTLARVQYVQACQQAQPGPLFEMQSKCACALDHVASKLNHEQYETLKTLSDALSIGGERGAVLRDNAEVRPQVARLKALEAQAAQACFLKSVP